MKMIKAKFSDVKDIFDDMQFLNKYGDEEDQNNIKTIVNCGDIITHDYAYYTPSNANWSYIIGLARIGNRFYRTVKVFGQIKAIAIVSVPQYKA